MASASRFRTFGHGLGTVWSSVSSGRRSTHDGTRVSWTAAADLWPYAYWRQGANRMSWDRDYADSLLPRQIAEPDSFGAGGDD
jgi:hypothetical protein